MEIGTLLYELFELCYGCMKLFKEGFRLEGWEVVHSNIGDGVEL